MSSRIDRLHAYHDGELGIFGRWQVRRWLARDPSARRELETLQAVGDAVRQAEVVPAAPDVWGAIEGRLRVLDVEREVARSATQGQTRLGWLLRPAAAGAALAAVALGLALFLAPGAPHAPGVVRWLDTGGQPVMVFDEGDATIIWLMQPDADQARQGRGLGLS